jgi:acyl-[acyl-carrier-protein] desaturase
MSIEAPRLQVITDKVLLAELAPIAAMALEAHITQKDKQQWLPVDLIPFKVVDEVPDLPDATLSGLFVNGLTEDNLPHYSPTLKRVSGLEEPWIEWTNRWVWEESLHTRGIDRYIDHIGVFDPHWLESARKQQLTRGEVPEPDYLAELVIYVTIQEELTRVAHSHLAKELVDSTGKRLFGNIAGDEARHHRFYAAISSGIRQQFPDEFAIAALPIIRNFRMPGTGIPNFDKHSNVMEQAGIFTKTDVLATIGKIAHELWAIDTLGDDVTSDEGKKASAAIIRRLNAADHAIKIIANAEPVSQQQILSWENGRPVMAA